MSGCGYCTLLTSAKRGRFVNDPVYACAEYFPQGPIRLVNYTEPYEGSYWGIVEENMYEGNLYNPIFFCPFCGRELPQMSAE